MRCLVGLPFNHIYNENEYLLQLYLFFLNETVLEINVKQKYEHLSFDPTVFQTDSSDGDYNSDSPYYTESSINKHYKRQ